MAEQCLHASMSRRAALDLQPFHDHDQSAKAR